MAFEVFDKRKSSLNKAPTVTLQKKGILSLNGAAHALIGQSKSVELLYDSDRKVVALRPSSEPHAYAFRATANATGTVLMSLTAFTEYYGIDTSVSRRFKPYMEDGLLCIDLAGESTKIIGNRSGASVEAKKKD